MYAGVQQIPEETPKERFSLAGSTLLNMNGREANGIMGHISYEVRIAGSSQQLCVVMCVCLCACCLCVSARTLGCVCVCVCLCVCVTDRA